MSRNSPTPPLFFGVGDSAGDGLPVLMRQARKKRKEKRMTKEELKAVRNEHYLYIYSDMDALEAVSFVADLLKAEANSLREHEPYAVRTIERLEQAYMEVIHLEPALDDEYSEEEDDE